MGFDVLKIQHRLESVNYRPTGFDYLRICLSACVVIYHSVVTSYGPAAQAALGNTLWKPFVAAILPMFFALSGFLVAGSLVRTKTLGGFLGLRAIRIFPALAVETFLSALILGALFTSLPLKEYFTAPLFFRYFLNILGEPQFHLPGVFENLPTTKVNGQLWTVPFELFCYLALAGLAIIGATKRRIIIPVAAVFLTVVGITKDYYSSPGDVAETTGAIPGYLLVVSFLCGVAIFMYRDEIRWNAKLGLICSVLALVLFLVPYGQFPAAFLISYTTIWIGLSNPHKVFLLKGADYSYGIFLYGFVIQQTYMYLLPDHRFWWLNILLSLPTAAAFAAFSWHIVEKPALKLRSKIFNLEKAYLLRRGIVES
ncbi:peptidoglycan/LPS O-acetylase OafA/YrhL [Rhodobacter sp. 140A]|nr:peptidoglycan/LPS O-acetylase OafA/YrhL [Rhodobacter sp. 140A]